MATELERYVAMVRQYQDKFGELDLGEGDMDVDVATMRQVMAYCLKLGKPYMKLTEDEQSAALDS